MEQSAVDENNSAWRVLSISLSKPPLQRESDESKLIADYLISVNQGFWRGIPAACANELSQWITCTHVSEGSSVPHQGAWQGEAIYVVFRGYMQHQSYAGLGGGGCPSLHSPEAAFLAEGDALIAAPRSCMQPQQAALGGCWMLHADAVGGEGGAHLMVLSRATLERLRQPGATPAALAASQFVAAAAARALMLSLPPESRGLPEIGAMAMFLSRLQALQKLPKEVLLELARTCVLVSAAPGALVCEEDTAGDCMYVLLAGGCQVRTRPAAATGGAGGGGWGHGCSRHAVCGGGGAAEAGEGSSEEDSEGGNVRPAKPLRSKYSSARPSLGGASCVRGRGTSGGGVHRGRSSGGGSTGRSRNPAQGDKESGNTRALFWIARYMEQAVKMLPGEAEQQLHTLPDNTLPTSNPACPGVGGSAGVAPVAAVCAAKWRALARRRTTATRSTGGAGGDEVEAAEQYNQLQGLASLLGPAVARTLAQARRDSLDRRQHDDIHDVGSLPDSDAGPTGAHASMAGSSAAQCGRHGESLGGSSSGSSCGGGSSTEGGNNRVGCGGPLNSVGGSTSSSASMSQVPPLNLSELLSTPASQTFGGSHGPSSVHTRTHTARSQLPPPPPAADTAAKRLLRHLGGGAAASTRLLEEMAARADPAPALYRLAAAVMAHSARDGSHGGGSGGGGCTSRSVPRRIARMVARVVRQGGVQHGNVAGRRVGLLARPGGAGAPGRGRSGGGGGVTATARSRHRAAELGHQLGVADVLRSPRSTEVGNEHDHGMPHAPSTTAGIASEFELTTASPTARSSSRCSRGSTAGGANRDADARRWSRLGAGMGLPTSGGGASNTNSVLSGFVLTSAWLTGEELEGQYGEVVRVVTAPGDSFGEMAAMARHVQRTASVVAMPDDEADTNGLTLAGADLMAISRRCLRRALQAARRTQVHDRVQALRAAGPFVGLDDTLLSSLALFCERRSVAAGTIILRGGQPDTQLFVLQQGQVELRAATDGAVGAAAGSLGAAGGCIAPAAIHTASRSMLATAPLGRRTPLPQVAPRSLSACPDLGSLTGAQQLEATAALKHLRNMPPSSMVPDIVTVLLGGGESLGLAPPPAFPTRYHASKLSSQQAAATCGSAHQQQLPGHKPHCGGRTEGHVMFQGVSPGEGTDGAGNLRHGGGAAGLVPSGGGGAGFKPGSLRPAVCLGAGGVFGLESRVGHMHRVVQEQEQWQREEDRREWEECEAEAALNGFDVACVGSLASTITGTATATPTLQSRRLNKQSSKQAQSSCGSDAGASVVAVAARPCSLLVVDLEKMELLGPQVLRPVAALLQGRCSMLAERQVGLKSALQGLARAVEDAKHNRMLTGGGGGGEGVSQWWDNTLGHGLVDVGEEASAQTPRQSMPSPSPTPPQLSLHPLLPSHSLSRQASSNSCSSIRSHGGSSVGGSDASGAGWGHDRHGLGKFGVGQPSSLPMVRGDPGPGIVAAAPPKSWSTAGARQQAGMGVSPAASTWTILPILTHEQGAAPLRGIRGSGSSAGLPTSGARAASRLDAVLSPGLPVACPTPPASATAAGRCPTMTTKPGPTVVSGGGSATFTATSALKPPRAPHASSRAGQARDDRSNGGGGSACSSSGGSAVSLPAVLPSAAMRLQAEGWGSHALHGQATRTLHGGPGWAITMPHMDHTGGEVQRWCLSDGGIPVHLPSHTQEKEKPH